MELFFFLVIFALFFSPVATIIRVIAHATDGFHEFSNSNSVVTKCISVVADICTLVVMPLCYLILVVGEGPNQEVSPWFFGTQSVMLYGGILMSSVTYFFAVNLNRPLSPELEAFFLFSAGMGIVTNFLIGIPMTDDLFWFSLVGNLPLIVLYFLVFTRRQALLNHATPEFLDQRRYEQTEILDYLPTGEPPAYVFDYSGPAGDFLRQHLATKILVSLLVVVVLLGLSAVVLIISGVEVSRPF